MYMDMYIIITIAISIVSSSTTAVNMTSISITHNTVPFQASFDCISKVLKPHTVGSQQSRLMKNTCVRQVVLGSKGG